MATRCLQQSHTPALDDTYITSSHSNNYLGGPQTTSACRRSKKIPPVSIIIPVFNQVEYTKRCIAAICRNTPAQTHFEIIIIDNASTDDTDRFLGEAERNHSNLQVLRNEENRYFAHACNQGAERARGEYLIFLNNDTEPETGWMENGLARLQSDPSIGVVGSKLLYPDRTIQHCGVEFIHVKEYPQYELLPVHRLRHASENDPRANTAVEFYAVTGACMFIRRHLFMEVGGFDTSYGMYFEDTDLCFKLRAHGKKVMYEPSSVIIHHESKSSPDRNSVALFSLEAARVFYERWGEEIHKMALRRYGVKSNPTLSLAHASHGTPQKRDGQILGPLGITVVGSGGRAGSVLLVDTFLPRFGIGEESTRLFWIAGLLKQLGYHVTYVARKGINQERYCEALERMGVETYATVPATGHRMGCRMDAEPLDLNELLSSKVYSVAYLSSYAIAEQYLSTIRSRSPLTRIVIDTADIHFLRDEREAEISRDMAAEERGKFARKVELAIYSQADALITVTKQDWRHIEAFLPERDHFVLPNIHFVTEHNEYSRSGLLFVGNFDNTRDTDAVLYFLNEIFPTVKRALPEITLRVVGNNLPGRIREWRGKGIAVTGDAPSTQPYLQKARVLVAPIRYGTGVEGRIGKAMASGLPVVTTSLGAEGMGLISGETACIADTPIEFAQYVVKLHSDDRLWQTISENGRLFIKNNYSPQIVRSAVQKMMNCLLRRKQEEIPWKTNIGLLP